MDIKDLKILDLVKIQHEGDKVKYEGYVIELNNDSVTCVWPEKYLWGTVRNDDTIFEVFRTDFEYEKAKAFVEKIEEVKKLWRCEYKKEDVLELTLDDIANKYGVDVSTIKIKK